MNDILSAMRWRYAVQAFDPSKTLDAETLNTILEAGRLAPSAFGVEPWRFLVIENPDLRAKLREASYGQPKVTDASHIVVIARRTDARTSLANELIARTAATQGKDPSELDGLRQMVEGSIAAKDDAQLDAWVRAQTYIPLGVMVEAAALLGVDSGPMEGFDPAAVDALLGLADQRLTATTMLALGTRGDDHAAARPKVRRPFEEVVTFVR